MKGPLDRTKVVLRHLPPTISQSNLVEQVDSRFSGRYHWLVFRPGKSRYLTDLLSDWIHGPLLSLLGTQFKTIVEYAPSQRVPKQWSKKDGREGTILKDPEYLEFLEFIAKPVENLPSAEIQLERKEAERAGAPKDDPIVTPLMDYVRQKRAAKGGARRTVLNGKPTRRVSGTSSRNPVSGSSKRGSEKRRTSTTMYVLRDSSKIVASKDKSTYLLVHKQDDQQLIDNSVNSAAVSGNEALEGESGMFQLHNDNMFLVVHYCSRMQQFLPKLLIILLLRSRISDVKLVEGSSEHSSNQGYSSTIIGPQSELRSQTSSQDRDKRPPRPPSLQSLQKDTNGAPEDKVVSNDLHAFPTEKQERRTRNKDRPDRGVWTPLRRSDGSHASDESLSSSASQTSQVDSAEGSYRHVGRRGSAYNFKDADGSSIVEGKSKRGGSSGYGSHENKKHMSFFVSTFKKR
ncbi:hypothetical protein DH2020_011290 [Rehmannia glutinosa]|uniref:UPF3 domain-containing protein n=1 Tax=Rehmannia glutinosa TaxID=99300 RepID=A0ABR0XD11_REHGL